MLVKALVAYGTRPELIKLAPLIQLMRRDVRFEAVVVSTEQHKDMLAELEQLFDIEPDHRLEIMEPDQTLNHILSAVVSKTDELLVQLKPDVVVVQGDTSTVFGVATAAFNSGIKVAHVEAGLRSGDMKRPFPEEFNRRAVSLVGDLHFAPTDLAKDNLLQEGIDASKVFMTGNTVVDAVQQVTNSIDGVEEDPNQILVTAHRRENHGQGIENICLAVKQMLEINPEIRFIWPVHPNPNVKPMVEEMLGKLDRVTLLPPLGYRDLLTEVHKARVVWSDSGGIQEEVASLRKPILILRNVTERPEVVEAGFGVLVGTSVDTIVTETKGLMEDPLAYERRISGNNPFGDGMASMRILDAMAGMNDE